MARGPARIQLQQETLQPYLEYIGQAETGMQPALKREAPFLWAESSAERMRKTAESRILAERWSGTRAVAVPHGLIHDWIGAAWVPATTVERTLATIQDYDNHKNIYRSEVIDSRLIRRNADDFEIYLRLRKKKLITVVLETCHDVHYTQLDATRWWCRSHTTRIAEVNDPGEGDETVLPPDTGYGFLWRLSSYWRFQERSGGVDLECRAISLTRDVPKGLGWAIDPIIRKLPKESLIHILEETRQALAPP